MAELYITNHTYSLPHGTMNKTMLMQGTHEECVSRLQEAVNTLRSREYTVDTAANDEAGNPTHATYRKAGTTYTYFVAG